MTTAAKQFYGRTGRKHRRSGIAKVNAHCRTCTDKASCPSPAEGTGNAITDQAPWCHKGPKAELPDPQSPQARKPIQTRSATGEIPPSQRLVVVGCSRFCREQCAELTVNGGGCPGLVRRVEDGSVPFCCESTFTPLRATRWEVA
jgi:hypothetical protein